MHLLTMLAAKAALRDCEFEELSHSPYSPDLTSRDFHLFPNSKHLEDDNELKTATEEWLTTQDKIFYFSDIKSFGNVITRV